MCWGWSFVPHAPFLCRIGIRISGDMAGLRSKAPTGDERQYGKDHHEHEHRTRRRSSCDKAAQCGADDNAHVGEHGDGGVDVFELDRIVSEVGWIGCGDGLGESHHKAQEHRAEQDDAGRAAKNEDRRAGCQRAHDAQQEMTARAPGVKRRATRKGSQDHEYVHKQDGQRCRHNRSVVCIGERSDDADKVAGLKTGVDEKAHRHQALGLHGQR